MCLAGEALDCDRRAFMLGRQLGLTKTYNLVHDPAVADVEVAHLRALHVEIDEAVRAAYGWDDLPLVLRVVETFTFGLLGQLSGACGPGVAVA